MKVLSFIGYSDSGKTTTIELVIKELVRRGYRVGSVKEIHNEAFALDANPTSDTHRHRAAGAELVTAKGLTEIDIMFYEKIDIKRILEFYIGCDFVICEGVWDAAIPIILTGSTVEDLENKLAEKDDDPSANWSDLVFCVSGRIADEISEYKGRPAISAITDITTLVSLIEAKMSESS